MNSFNLEVDNFIKYGIDANTTPQEIFEYLKTPSVSIHSKGTPRGFTIFAKAAYMGNVDLIDCIYTLGGKALLFTPDESGAFPLHMACRRKNDLGCAAAKKLVQLGTPVNIRNDSFKDIEFNIKLRNQSDKNPLEEAINYKNIKTAAMLLRLGGIAREEIKGYGINVNKFYNNILETAKKEIMTDNEKLFKCGMSLKNELPEDVLKHILSLSAKL
jgi:ankyrin repeat protein